jgi:hypothetical protein
MAPIELEISDKRIIEINSFAADLLKKSTENNSLVVLDRQLYSEMIDICRRYSIEKSIQNLPKKSLRRETYFDRRFRVFKSQNWGNCVSSSVSLSIFGSARYHPFVRLLFIYALLDKNFFENAQNISKFYYPAQEKQCCGYITQKDIEVLAKTLGFNLFNIFSHKADYDSINNNRKTIYLRWEDPKPHKGVLEYEEFHVLPLIP